MPIAARAKMSDPVAPSRRGGDLLPLDCRPATHSSGPTGTADKDTRQVTVVGAGKVQGTPDTLTVNASIEFIAPDVTAAMNQTSDRQQAVIDALVGSGIDRKDISTTQVSLQPQFARRRQHRRSSAISASNSIDVKIRKLDTASQALALIVSTGGDATRINSVNYSIEDDSQLVKDARARAFDDAKDRAQQYAQLSGLSLGKVISITESAGTTPPTAADADAAGAPRWRPCRWSPASRASASR